MPGGTDEEQAWLEAPAFHKVSSRRVARGGRLVRSPRTPLVLMALGIVLEPLRWITGWAMYFPATVSVGIRGNHR